MQTITSRQNQVVRTFRTLADVPDAEGARLLLDGVRLVDEGLRAGASFELVAVSTTHLERGGHEAEAARALERAGATVVAVSEPVLRAVSPSRTPSGISAIVTRVPSTPGAVYGTREAFVLVVADVQDPGNVGSLVRSAEAAGMTGVLVCGAAANPFSWKAVRGSMGSVLRLPVARARGLHDVLTGLREHHVRTVAAIPRGGLRPEDATWRGNVALLLGSEGQGLGDDIVGQCDERVSIPMAPAVDSLSVAAAGAVLVFSARSQRG